MLGKCDSCETELRLQVLRDMEHGFYIGVSCTCGQSDQRYSDYYRRFQYADEDLQNGTFKLTKE